MKKNYLIGLVLMLGIFIFGCSSNDMQKKSEGQITLANLTLEDVTNAFAESELHIKPQMDADYPELYDVKPKAYELLDGIVFIYAFNNNKELRKGLNNIHDVYISESRPRAYEVNNILVVYLPGQPEITPPALENKIDARIKEIIQDLKQINNKK